MPNIGGGVRLTTGGFASASINDVYVNDSFVHITVQIGQSTGMQAVVNIDEEDMLRWLEQIRVERVKTRSGNHG